MTVKTAPPKKRQRMTAEKRKQQIIAAAQKVFVRMGMNGARTRDLAKEAGVNEATLFLYFKNKQEIFDAAIIEPLSSLVKQLMERGEAFSATVDTNSKDNIGIEAHKEIYSSSDILRPLLTTALFSDEANGQMIYKKDIYPMIKQLTKAADAAFHLGDDEELEFIVIAALGLNYIMQLHHSFLGTSANPDVIAERIANLLIHGVQTKP